MRPTDEPVRVALLGGARVRWRGEDVDLDGWPRRAAELVELLALAGGHRLLRDQVVDALWPHLDAAAGAANLRKAAHHARRALGTPDAVVLRGGAVVLFPDTPVATDVAAFERAADAALRGADPDRCAAAADLYAGDLLPGALYEEWTQERRAALRSRHRDLLRRCGRWDQLVAADPTDEVAYRGLMRAAVDRGDRATAIRWYGRLRTVLERELGVLPTRETEALHDACVAGLRPAEPELVGRAVEHAQAEAVLDDARRGERGALVVRGTAGLGKTALCRRIAATARARGWTVTATTALGPSAPYAPLVAVVERALARDRDLLDRLPVPTRSVLAELTALAAPAPPLQGGLTRHHVIGALRRVLVGGGAPALLVLDDAHRTDEATIDVLLHLAVDTAGDVLVVLAHRPGPAPEALERGVARLTRSGRAAVVDLHPLDREDAALLVRAAAPGVSDLEGVVDRAGGNPFFLHELARNPAGSAWQAVADRCVELDADALALVERLAVAGDDLGPAEAVAVSELPEAQACALLDAALDAEVLVVEGARYRFRHDLVRQALVERVPPHRRLARHREIARRLAEVEGAPAAVAGHWLAGARPDEAIPFLLAAGRRAVELGAYRDALGHLDRLLEHAPRHDRALFLRAEALEALGDERAPAAFAAAARAVEGAEGWHDVRARQALASVRAGRPEEALDALEGVHAASLEGRLAHALALCGAAAMGRADPEVGVAKAVETRRLAVASGDPAAVVIASWAEAAAAHVRGDLPETVLAGLRETYALPQLAITVFDGQLCVVERLLYGGRPYPELIAFADALEAEAERLGAARGRAFAATFRGEAKLLTGRLDEAEDDLALGERRHREIGATAGAAVSLQRRAEAALYRGDPARADVLLDEALAVARESSIGFHLLDRIYGTRIAAARSPAAAVAALDEAESAVHGARETCPGCRINLAVPAAIAAAGAGDLDRADGYQGTVEALTTILMRLPGWYAALDEVRGHRARAAGDRAAADRHFAAAASAYRAAGHPLDADRCAAAGSGVG